MLQEQGRRHVLCAVRICPFRAYRHSLQKSDLANLLHIRELNEGRMAEGEEMIPLATGTGKRDTRKRDFASPGEFLFEHDV